MGLFCLFCRLFLPAFLCLCLCLFFSGVSGCLKPAYAQSQTSVFFQSPTALGDVRSLQREPESLVLQKVSSRLEPSLRPVPLHWRGFVFYPLLTLNQRYDTNIFATAQGEEEDWVTHAAPSLFVAKELGRHRFSGNLKAGLQRFRDNTSENVENISLAGKGLIEARHDILLPAELAYEIGHENREQNFSQNFAKKPIRFKSFASAFGILYKPGRLELGLVGRYSRVAFDDGVSAAGTPVVRRDNDRNQTEIELRGTYNFRADHAAFVALKAGLLDYRRRNFENGSFSGLPRDGSTLSLTGGFETRYKGLLEGFIGAGYNKRYYDSNAVDDIEGLKLNAKLDLNITKNATLGLTARREISEDNEIARGAETSLLGLTLDYQILRNLISEAYLNYALADFDGINREDEVTGAGLGLEYIINPGLSLGASVGLKKRDSDQQIFDYERSTVSFAVNARL